MVEEKVEEKVKEEKDVKVEEKKEEVTQVKPVKDSLRKPSEKRKREGITVKAKKKRSSARAVIKRGKGVVKINKRNLEIFSPDYLKMIIGEPLKMVPELRDEVDISINVKGSGFMSQAVAARGAIAKALVRYSGDKKLKEKFLNYDRLLLVDDIRRKEPKKPLGRGARAKKQASKR